jgi:hypothetical protein
MSAYDVAGAAVSGALLAICVLVILCADKEGDGDMAGPFWFGLIALGWLAFCISRICGAHR